MKLRFPGFKILDRYILGKFLATYFFAIAMIIIVVVLFDYVEKIDDFTELHAPLRDVIFDYYRAGTPPCRRACRRRCSEGAGWPCSG